MVSMIPTYLRCEYLVNPLAIGAAAPRLSWTLAATSEGLRALRQTAYQILVASSSETLARDRADLWDSGEIDRNQTNQIEYAGPSLRSGQQCWWKVRVWDQASEVSAWSDAATWAMGLLAASDWKAQWIEAPIATEESKPGPCPLMRKQFRIEGPVKRAIAYASALGLYELRLNGQRVGDQVLSPEWTDYTKRVQYQAFDVTQLIEQGDNAAGATLAEGWYAGRVGLTHIVKNGPIRHIYGDRPRLFVQLHVELADGRTEVIVTDSSWKFTIDGPLRSSDILDGETYDSRREMAGWDAAGFADGAWKPVQVVESVSAKLVVQPNEPMRVVKRIQPVAVNEPKPGVYVYDLGQEIAGWCRIGVKGAAGQTVTLRHSEMLNEDGTIYITNLRVPEDGGPLGARATDTFVLKGAGEETFEPRFTYHGFRYVEVAGLEYQPALDALLGCAFWSDAPETGRFECSDAMLNQLFSNILWTQRDNFPSVPTDCPQRDERLGWTGDIQVYSQTAMFNTDLAAFFTKWLGDLRDAQAEDGRFPDVAPHPFNPNERFTGTAAWGDAGTVVPWRQWVNYGDRRLIAEHFESARRWVDWIHTSNPDLIWLNKRHNDYGDWLHGDTLIAEGWPKTGGEVPKEVFATAFFAHSTDLVGRMAAVIGRAQEAAKYNTLATEIRAAFCNSFVTSDGRIKGHTQAGYALALAFELLPENLRVAAAEHMVAGVGVYGDHMSTGFNSTIRMMLELSRWGYSDVAYQLINCKTFPSWGYMIANGATTIWERWDGYVKGRGFQDPGMNSFCHYAIGAVGEWMYRVMLGINPDESQPGYRHMVLRPIPGGGLTHAGGEYASIAGTIGSVWKVDGDMTRYTMTIPPNSSATVFIPAAHASSITEGDQPATKAPGVTFVRMQADAAVFEVLSGTYQFAVKK